MSATPLRRVVNAITAGAVAGLLLAVAPLVRAQPTAVPQPSVPAQPTPPVLPNVESDTGVQRYPIAPSPWQFVDPAYAEEANYARAEAEGVRRTFKLPGISAGVLIDGRIVWQEGFGFADVALQRPVTPDTRFRIGSISKPITALALQTLVEAGRLDPDAPIQAYVPSFPVKDGGAITARLLVGHLSGIRHYARGEDDTIRPRRYETMEDALSRFSADPLAYPPNTRFRYSTYGYTLLGAAIESAAGEPFLDYLRASVLDPIGMEATSADRSDGQIDDLTSFYHRDRESNIVPAPAIDTSYKWAGGGLVSTSADLLRFAQEMMHPTIISQASRDQMWTAMTTRTGESTSYGMGWALDLDVRHRRVVAHSGGQVGCTAYLLIFPDLDAASIVLCNATNAELGRDLAVAVVEPFITRRDLMRRQQDAGAESPAEPAAQP